MLNKAEVSARLGIHELTLARWAHSQGYRKIFNFYSDYVTGADAAKTFTKFYESDGISKVVGEAKPPLLSKDFGLPHLEMAQSNTSTLLNLGIFPASGAFDGRLFAESWESSNLYWARLADEMGYSPAMLNVLVPNLTRRMVANIFATNIDDWPAVLRAMERTGDEFRRDKVNGRETGAMTGQVSSFPIAEIAESTR